MVKFFSEKVLEAFSSMKTTDNISLEDFNDLQRLQNYYIDPFNYINTTMQEEDNFIIGRRGTGKSTLLYRAFIECINSWDEEKVVYKRNILPIYIDLSKCESLIQKIGEGETFDENFTIELVKSFIKYINLSKHKIISNDTPKELISKFELFMISLDQFLSGENLTCKKYSLGDFLDNLSVIREIIDAQSIYVFIDEYSELCVSNQKLLAGLLKRLRGTRRGIYFKVCAITDNYDLGEIRLQRDFYEISLDLYKFVEKSNGLRNAFNRLEKFTSNIIQERLNAFGCEIEIDRLFNDYAQSIIILARAGTMSRKSTN